jgi:hypothetical protein
MVRSVTELVGSGPEKPDFRIAMPSTPEPEPVRRFGFMRPIDRLMEFLKIQVEDQAASMGFTPAEHPRAAVMRLPGAAGSASPELLSLFAIAQQRAAEVQGHDRRTPVEHLSLSIGYLAYDRYRQHGDDAPKHAARDLVDAGLRAPIAAFPASYVADLVNRLETGARKADSGMNDLFTRPERDLFGHWQALADKGIDPVDGEAKGDGRPSPWISQETVRLARRLGQIVGVVADAPRPVTRLRKTDMIVLAHELARRGADKAGLSSTPGF